MTTWHPVPAPCGWRKRNFDMRIVTCPRTQTIDFVGTKPAGLRMPRETAGRRWRVWTCACGAKHSFVGWKNHRGRRLYSVASLDWAKKHAACASLTQVAVRVRARR